MDEKRKKTLGRALMAAAPVLVFAAVWGILGLFHSPYATWLTVEAQRYAVVGWPLDVRITVARAAEPSMLVVNVYLLGSHQTVVGRLPAPSPPIEAHAGGVYDFRVDVKDVDRMAYVQLVIWVSATGDWQTRTAGASTKPIPVRAAGRDRDERLRKVVVFANYGGRRPDPHFRANDRPFQPGLLPAWPSPGHFLLAALLVVAGAVFIALARRSKPGPGQPPVDGRLWTVAAIILFLLAAAELLLLEERISRLGRDIVVGLDLYNLRQPYQKLAIALLAAALTAALALSVRPLRKRKDRLPLAVATLALAGYLGLALAGTLSYHYVDVLKRHSILDVLKAACAAAAFLAGLLLLRRSKPAP